MKKIIKRFWGVGLVLVLLSTLLVGAVPQASALPYIFFNSRATPNSVATDVTLAPSVAGAVPDGFSVLDVGQSGTTIIVTATDNIPTPWIYRSTNSGASWARVIPSVMAAASYNQIAIAPDDPNIFAIVDASALPHTVYLTINGGITFSPLTAFANALTFVNDIAISPLFGASRYLTVVGNTDGIAVATGYNQGVILQWTIGAIAPAWANPGVVPAAYPATNNYMAIAYSKNFLADNAMLVVSANVSGHAAGTGTASQSHSELRVFSYNTGVWDAGVDVTFPRELERSTQTYPTITATANSTQPVTRVDITLDDNFYLGDAASQIGFIGATISDNLGTQIGGVYSVGSYTTAGGIYTLTQILTGTGINSVAFDGTNLMAAQYDNLAAPAAALTIWRCNNPLATIGWSFLPNSTFKTPGTGSFPLVLYNSGVGYAFSRGTGSAVAKTTDYGKSFDGIALVNSHFGNMLDLWVSPDASRMYALTSDNSDLNLWRRDGTVWQRVFILAGAGSTQIGNAQNWLVRASDTDTDAVYLGLKGGTTLYRSTDAGATIWTIRSAPANIADFAVQDASTLYVGRGNFVSKSINGAFTWLPATGITGTGGAGGACYSIKLLAADQLVVGGAAGGVAISANGGTSFTYLGAQAGAGNTLVDATGVATGDTVFALDCAGAGNVYYWIVGTSVVFTASGTATVGATGIAYAQGVLYVMDQGTPALNRYLYPTVAALWALGATDAKAGGAAYIQNNMINNLQAVEGNGVTLYARAGDTTVTVLDTIDTFTDYLTNAAAAPVPTYPINDAIIPINSISGAINTFVFQWDASPTIAYTGIFNTTYNYDLLIYLDEAGTIAMAGSTAGTPVLAAASPAGFGAAHSLFATVGFSDADFAGVPGTTYYWRTRVSAAFPVQSYWSSMQSFTVQQLTAIVPVISSPENGGEVSSVSPAFSWSPIANATSYRFELASDADFTDIVYTVDPTSAGASYSGSLNRGQQYYWRVKALTPTEGEWSTVANFIVAELPATTEPPVTITTAPAPTVTAVVSVPPATTTIVTVETPAKEVVNPSYIWAIIVVGAVLVIAVIILIVRTRRTV